jgi:hypothetical protein
VKETANKLPGSKVVCRKGRKIGWMECRKKEDRKERRKEGRKEKKNERKKTGKEGTMEVRKARRNGGI